MDGPVISASHWFDLLVVVGQFFELFCSPELGVKVWLYLVGSRVMLLASYVDGRSLLSLNIVVRRTQFVN